MELVTRLGVDVGQRHDPTALCVVEETQRDTESAFIVRHVERLPLGTTYPLVARRIADVVRLLEERLPRGSRPWCVVDVTGVGRPIFDLVEAAIDGTRTRLTAATFTATDRQEGGIRSRELRVGKSFLVSRLQALLQTRRVQLPDTPEARALADELLTFELRVTDSATVQAGAFRIGTHDDLVVAAGLALLDPDSSRSRKRAHRIPHGLAAAQPAALHPHMRSIIDGR